jgi:hypothetical protein
MVFHHLLIWNKAFEKDRIDRMETQPPMLPKLPLRSHLPRHRAMISFGSSFPTYPFS